MNNQTQSKDDKKMTEAAKVIFQDILQKTCTECRVECTEEIKKQCIDAMRIYADRKSVQNEIIASLYIKFQKARLFH